MPPPAMDSERMSTRSPIPRPNEAQLAHLLRLHRRALGFRNAQAEADLTTTVDLRWRQRLAARCSLPPAPRKARILYSVGTLCRRRFPTSIDRVVLALREELGRLPVPVVPVAFDGQCWREASAQPSTDDPKAPRMAADGPPVTVQAGDQLLIAELDYRLPVQGHRELMRLKAAGMRIGTIVQDVFIVIRPEWFPLHEILAFDAWLGRQLSLADRILCPSQHSARQLRLWLASAALPSQTPRRALPVSVIELGSDGLAEGGPAPSWAPAPGAAGFSVPDDSCPTFLAVAAIHPRKGVDTLLAGCSALWGAGLDFRLVLSGRSLDPELTARIRAHPQLGDRLLFPGFLGDAQLRAVAARAQAMILPSREEGFGLPMAEAAALGLPVIARDIPVFREIAGDQPFWFQSARGQQHTLAARLRDWLELPEAQRRRHVPTLAGGTWARTARQIHAVLLDGLDFDRLQVPEASIRA